MPRFLSLDSSSDALRAVLWVEVELRVGSSPDPLEIMIREEEGDPDFFDADLACAILNGLHNRQRSGR